MLLLCSTCNQLILHRVTYTSQEPALPVRMQRLYGFDSWEVGLVFLAAVLPTIFCERTGWVPEIFLTCLFRLSAGPFSGWLADRKGTEWISTLCIGFALPWWIVISFRLPVWMFVTAFAIESRSLLTDLDTYVILTELYRLFQLWLKFTRQCRVGCCGKK
jgi:hypothetical protein